MAKKKSSSRLDLTSATIATATINTRQESTGSTAEDQGNNVNKLPVVVNEQQQQKSVVDTRKKSKSSSKVSSLSKSKSTSSLAPSRTDLIPSPTTVSTTSHNLLSPAWIANFFCLNKKKKSKLTISGGDKSINSESQTNPDGKCCKHNQHLCDSNCIQSLSTSNQRNSRLRDSISPELPEDVIKELKQTLTSNNYNNQGKSSAG